MDFPTKSILVYDIETDSTDIEQAKLKFFGCYSYLSGKRYYLTDSPEDLEFIKEIFDNHDVIVGFNQKGYDNPIMEKYGIDFRGKVQVDLYEALAEPYLDTKTRERRGGKGRGGFMGLDLNSWSLSNIVSALKLGEYKQDDFDYNILKKTVFTKEEKKYILDYLAQDITITKRLFEFTHKFYSPFIEYLPTYDVLRFNYITSSIASLSYKIICNLAELPETYGNNATRDKYAGGFVFKPRKSGHVGTVLCLDFNSLYPSIYRCFNLTMPANHETKPEDTFTGNEIISVEGKYRTDEYGAVERVLGELYHKRQMYKADGDKREYLIKIIINSFYGASASPIFEQVYNPTAAADCTRIGRQMVKFAAKYLEERGIEFLYGDTDSCYVAINDYTIDEAMEIAGDIVDIFKNNMPFPNDDFGFGLDAVMDAMWFVRNPDGTFKKKNYIYVERLEDDSRKLKLKGLQLIKSDASKLAVQVFNNHLKEQIIENLSIDFRKDYLEQLIWHELREEGIDIAVKGYKVRPTEEYSSETSIHYQISDRYGEGYHELIPNFVFGVGKGKKYCTIEEFEQNDLSVEDIDLESVWKNLSPFVLMCEQCYDRPVDTTKKICSVCVSANMQTGLGDFV